MKSRRLTGQHFLRWRDVARRMVEYAEVAEDDVVLEVGPGHGEVTRYLVERAGRVIAVEKDPRLAEGIRLRFRDRVEVVEADVLEIELPEFTKCVSSLPYRISSEFTVKLLEHTFRSAVLLYQKEFGERLAAGPGSKAYSRLSVYVYCRADVELLETVPRDAFRPRPAVDGVLVRFQPRDAPFSTCDWELYFRLVKLLFTHRRKKVGTALRRYHSALGVDVLDAVPYSDLRVEQMSPEMIGELADRLVGCRDAERT